MEDWALIRRLDAEGVPKARRIPAQPLYDGLAGAGVAAGCGSVLIDRPPRSPR